MYITLPFQFYNFNIIERF